MPFLTSFLLLYLSTLLDPEDHRLLRYVFGMFAFISIGFSIWMAFIVNIVVYSTNAPLENAIGTYLWAFIILAFGVFAYIMLYFVVKSLAAARKKKELDLKY